MTGQSSKRPRATLAVVALLLAAGSGACGFRAAHRLSMDTRAELGGTVERFLGAVSSGRHGEAYPLMSEAYRSRVSAGRFEEAVSAGPYWRGARALRFREQTLDGGSAVVSGVLESDAGEVRAVFSFSREAERWSIAGVTLGGLPAVP